MTKCLVVDDVEVTRFTATEFLSDMGVEVVVARNSDEALDQLRMSRIDVVLLDWHLGKSTADDLLAEIRSEFGAKLPIVVFSAVDPQTSGKEALAAGASGFLEKPTTRELLQQCLKELHLPVG